MPDTAKKLDFTTGLLLVHTTQVLARIGYLIMGLLYCQESSVGDSNACMDDFEFALTYTVEVDVLLIECHERGLDRADIFDACWQRLVDRLGVLPEEVGKRR